MIKIFEKNVNEWLGFKKNGAKIVYCLTEKCNSTILNLNSRRHGWIRGVDWKSHWARGIWMVGWPWKIVKWKKVTLFSKWRTCFGFCCTSVSFSMLKSEPARVPLLNFGLFRTFLIFATITTLPNWWLTRLSSPWFYTVGIKLYRRGYEICLNNASLINTSVRMEKITKQSLPLRNR